MMPAPLKNMSVLNNLLMKQFYRILFIVGYHTGIYSLVRFFRRKSATIITYHGVSEDVSKTALQLRSLEGIHLSVQSFQKQITYLKKYHNICSLSELTKMISQKKSFKSYSVCITFDDGYKNNLTVAAPLLKKLDVPATFFLTTGEIDKNNILWMSQVTFMVAKTSVSKTSITIGGKNVTLHFITTQDRRNSLIIIKSLLKRISDGQKKQKIKELSKLLKQSGIIFGTDYDLLNWNDVKQLDILGTLGVHTLSHPSLTKLPKDKAEKQIVQSKKLLEKKVGHSIHYFAYPFGSSADFNRQTQNMTKKTGFACALTTVPGKIKKTDDVQTLKRVMIEVDMDFYSFIARLEGIFI